MKRFCWRMGIIWIALALCGALAGTAWAAGITELSGVAEQNGAVVLRAPDGKIAVRCFEKGTVQFEVFAAGINSDFRTYLTVPDALRAIPCRLDSGAGEISAEGVRMKYTLRPFSFAFLAADGKTLLRLAPDGLSWVPDGSYRFAFAKELGDGYFGTGEPFAGLQLFDGRGPFSSVVAPVRLNQDGEKREMWTRHFPSPSYLGAPFFLTRRGYGLLIENPVRAVLDFSAPAAVVYRAEGGPFRFYFFGGTTPAQILDAYSQLTGRTPLPPRWVTGYMQSRYGYASEAEFRWLMDNFRTRQIPCDVLIFDLDWFASGQSWQDLRMGELRWSPVNFPNAAALQEEIHRRGFKSITIVEPYFWSSSSNFAVVRDRGFAAQNDRGEPYVFRHWSCPQALLLDFLNPAAAAWFADQVKAIHETGVDGWWTDLNEPENDFADMRYGGLPQNQGHNLQALLQHRAMAAMYERDLPNERLFIMSRGTFVGDWRYGAGIWSGDVNSSWGHLQNQVPIGLSAALTGFGLWNSDVGGFNGRPSPELYTRWMQFGAFCPIYRAHGAHAVREPWSFGETAERDVKKIMELRYRLTPYHYTTLSELHTAGLPPMRAMFLEFPGADEAYEADRQFMYGPWLLVAPVTKAGERERVVYFPKGNWTNFWTEQEISGWAMLPVAAPLDRIPLFVREGAILPMGPPLQFIGEKPLDPLTLHVYPGPGPSSYNIYDDDGRTNFYHSGQFTLTAVAVTPGQRAQVKVGSRQGSYAGMPATQSYLIVYHHCARPVEVALNDQRLPESPVDIESASPTLASWSYDAEKKLVKVFVTQGAPGFVVTIASGTE